MITLYSKVKLRSQTVQHHSTDDEKSVIICSTKWPPAVNQITITFSYFILTHITCALNNFNAPLITN